jgi:hypothetical protein
MNTKIITALLAGLATLAGAAQVATPRPGTERVRSQHQQQRIGQGIQSGQLTGREAGHLENREASIHHEKQSMRAADGGHLTRSDRRTLNRRQNRTSAAIARDKHNARVR